MKRSFPLGVVLGGLILVAGCAPGHRLAEVQLEGREVAVMAAIPPAQHRITGPWILTDRGRFAPPRVREGLEAARAAQRRLDAAAGRIDVSEAIARRLLLENARLLGLRPVNDPEAADLILDVRLLDFSFAAARFDGAVRAIVEADVLLERRDTGEVIWERRVSERFAVPPAWFDAAELGRRLTPRLMTRLSTDQLAVGLEQVARVAADRMAARLAEDYRRAHRQEDRTVR